jgi:hypothetical protein
MHILNGNYKIQIRRKCLVEILVAKSMHCAVITEGDFLSVMSCQFTPGFKHKINAIGEKNLSLFQGPSSISEKG